MTLTIDRPEKANALPASGKLEMAQHIKAASAQDDVLAVVIIGGGDRHFCAGSDVAELADLDAPRMLEMLRAEHAMYVAALRSPKPVVAAVNGYAMGTGLLLVVSCDYAVGSSSARVGVPELAVGASTPLEGLL